MTIKLVRRSLLATLLAFAAAVTAACSGASSSADRSFVRPDLDEVSQVVADQPMPFDRYLLPFDDRVRLQKGNATLVERCVADRGFEVAIYGDYLRPPGVVPLGGLVGTMSREHASRYGYQAGPDDPFKLGVGMYQRTLTNLTLDPQLDPDVRNDPAFKNALEGKATETGTLPDGVEAPDPGPGSGTYDKGCWDTVEGAIDAHLVDTLEIEGDVFDLAAGHPVVTQAMTQWSTCMTKRGHHYETVIGGFEEFAYTAPTPKQTGTALDDVECTADSGWANFFYAALTNYQEQAIELEPELFEASLIAQQNRLAAVERALGSG